MCRVRSFLCCIDPIAGGLLLGYLHFAIGIIGLFVTSIVALLVLAKYPLAIYFAFSVALLLLFFVWSVCSWSLIKGVSYREAKKIRRFKFFAFFCLVLKFIVLVGALCAIYELDVVRERREEDINMVLFAVSHFIILSLLWEFYILLFTHSLEMTFYEEEEEEQRYRPKTYHSLIKA